MVGNPTIFQFFLSEGIVGEKSLKHEDYIRKSTYNNNDGLIIKDFFSNIGVWANGRDARTKISSRSGVVQELKVLEKAC